MFTNIRQKYEQLKEKHPLIREHIVILTVSIFATVAIFHSNGSLWGKVFWLSFSWLLVVIVTGEYVEMPEHWEFVLSLPVISFIIAIGVLIWQSSWPLWAKIAISLFLFGAGGG